MVCQKQIYRPIMFIYTLIILIIYYLTLLNTIESRANSSWMWDWTRTRLAEDPVSPANSLVERYLMHFKHNSQQQLKKLELSGATDKEHENKPPTYNTTKQYRKSSDDNRSKFYMTVPSFMRATAVRSSPTTPDDTIDRNVYLPEDFPLSDDFYDLLNTSTVTVTGQYVYPLYIRAVRTAMELLGFHRSRTRTSNHSLNISSKSTIHSSYSTSLPVDIRENVYLTVTQNGDATVQSDVNQSITGLDYHNSEFNINETTPSNVEGSTEMPFDETDRSELNETTKSDPVKMGKESVLKDPEGSYPWPAWTGGITTDGPQDVSISDASKEGNRTNENLSNDNLIPLLYDTLAKIGTNTKLPSSNYWSNERGTDQKAVEPMVLMMLEKNPSRMAVYKCFKDQLPTNEFMEHNHTAHVSQDIYAKSTENTIIHINNTSTFAEDTKNLEEINLPGHLKIKIENLLGLNGSESNLTLPCTLKLKYPASLLTKYSISELRFFNGNNVDYNLTEISSIEPNVITFADLTENPPIMIIPSAKTTMKYHLEQNRPFSLMKWLSKDIGANQTSQSHNNKLRNPVTHTGLKNSRKIFSRTKWNPMSFYTFASTTTSQTPSYDILFNATVESELNSSHPLTTAYISESYDSANYSQLIQTRLVTYDILNICEHSTKTGEYLLSNNSNSADTDIFLKALSTPVSFNYFPEILARKLKNMSSHRTGFMERIRMHSVPHKLKNNSSENQHTKQVSEMNEEVITSRIKINQSSKLYGTKDRVKRDMRNPYDFQLRYLSYPMNPDFFKALESCKEAETKLRRTPLSLKRYQMDRFRREAPCKRKRKHFSITKMSSRHWQSKNESPNIKKSFL